jgi:hypothetical protein
MNENPKDRPYEEIPGEFYRNLRPCLTNGWGYARDYSSEISHGYRPPPTGPCEYILPFLIHEMIKTIELEYEFFSGTEAEIQALDEGSPVHRIAAPGGHLIVPVGPARKWKMRLPAGTSVHVHIDKWQKDREAIARRQRPEITPEVEARARKLIAEWEAENGRKFFGSRSRTEP